MPKNPHTCTDDAVFLRGNNIKEGTNEKIVVCMEMFYWMTDLRQRSVREGRNVKKGRVGGGILTKNVLSVFIFLR